MKKRVIMTIEHVANPLNVYCRLSHITGRQQAYKIGRWYEHYLFKPIIAPILNIKYTWRCANNEKPL